MTIHLDEKLPDVSHLHPETPVVLLLLGASNLSRGCFAFSSFMKKNLSPRPVEVLIASGPGRGYCAIGGLLNAKYLPISTSDIFKVAQSKADSGCQVVALVTDIGNDIMYSVSLEKLIATFQQIFDRLESMNAEVFYTTLPAAFEGKVHPIWFYILRTLLLPFSRVSYDEATAGIVMVNKYLRESKAEHRHLVAGMDHYLGFDEIHYGWLSARSAWSHLAEVMLRTLGIETKKKITLGKMLQSYGHEFRQVVCTDMLGFKKINPEHY